jgi:hypothetical protein
LANHDDFTPDDYYWDDVPEVIPAKKSWKKLNIKLVALTATAIFGYTTLGSTFATNITLSSGRVEFGQGYLGTTACDSSITVTPYATFANASGNAAAYKLTDIQVSDLGSGCYGKDLIIRAYDSASATALDLYQTGGSTTYNSVQVYNNNGTFTLAGAGLTHSEINAVTNGFRVTLFNSASPASVAKALATSVYKITVETVPHDATLTQSNIPSGSLTFNGQSPATTKIEYAANNAFVLGTGDFTVEAWANLSNANQNQTFYDAGGDVNSSNSFAFWIEGGALKIRRNGTGADIQVAMESSWWSSYRHYAAVRGNGKFRIYVDGVMKAEAADTGYSINRNAPVIGKLNNFNTYELRGQLRNLRVVKGTALYSSNFTPPTTPLSNVSGTLLLLLAQNSGNPTYDSSDNHFTPSNSSNLPTWLAP